MAWKHSAKLNTAPFAVMHVIVLTQKNDSVKRTLEYVTYFRESRLTFKK